MIVGVRRLIFRSTAPHCHLTVLLQQGLDETSGQYAIATKGTIGELICDDKDIKTTLLAHPCRLLRSFDG